MSQPVELEFGAIFRSAMYTPYPDDFATRIESYTKIAGQTCEFTPLKLLSPGYEQSVLFKVLRPQQLFLEP